MEPMVLTCGGCGARIRTSRPQQVRGRPCPRCQALLGIDVEPRSEATGGIALDINTTSPTETSRLQVEPLRGSSRATRISAAALTLVFVSYGGARLWLESPAGSDPPTSGWGGGRNEARASTQSATWDSSNAPRSSAEDGDPAGKDPIWDS